MTSPLVPWNDPVQILVVMLMVFALSEFALRWVIPFFFGRKVKQNNPRSPIGAGLKIQRKGEKK